MVLGSPTYDQRSLPNLSMGLPAPTSNYWGSASEGRSRSASVSMRDPTSVPASPVAVARAAVQRTPPPFLQRRLFNGDEDVSSTSSSSSGRGMKITDPEEDFEIALDDVAGEVEIDSIGLGLSSTNERVVRRPVSRRPNLLPKPKSHLRVLSQLRAEDGPADSLEIASEATLHRLSRSCASTVPVIRPTTGTPINPNSSGEVRPGSSSGGLSHSKPTPNRFPEQAEDEEEKREESEGSGEGEAEDGSEFGGMSMGYTTEDEDEQRKSVMWTGIRGGSNGGNGNFGLAAGPSSVRGSPGSERGKMEMDYNSPSTPGWQNSARPGKRKCTSSSLVSSTPAHKIVCSDGRAFRSIRTVQLLETTSDLSGTRTPFVSRFTDPLARAAAPNTSADTLLTHSVDLTANHDPLTDVRPSFILLLAQSSTRQYRHRLVTRPLFTSRIACAKLVIIVGGRKGKQFRDAEFVDDYGIDEWEGGTRGREDEWWIEDG